MIVLINIISEINYNDWEMISVTISKKMLSINSQFFKIIKGNFTDIKETCMHIS